MAVQFVLGWQWMEDIIVVGDPSAVRPLVVHPEQYSTFQSAHYP